MGLFTAIALVIVVDNWSGPLRSPDQADLLMFSKPTQGSLADDQAYLALVLQAWKECKGKSRFRPYHSGRLEVRREPRVLWAGETPTGRAAIVVEMVRAHVKAGLSKSFRVDTLLMGLVESGLDGNPAVIDETGTESTSNAHGFLAGPDGHTLILLDEGVPVGYTFDQRFPASMTAVEFKNGAAAIAIPPQAGQYRVYVGERKSGETTWVSRGDDLLYSFDGPPHDRDPGCRR